MKTLKKLLKPFRLILALFPSKLPTGVKEFNSFYLNIVEIYSLPDLPSYKHAMATMIMHLSPQTMYKPKLFFSLTIKKAMANQIAYSIIEECREIEKKLEAESKLQPPPPPSNGKI